MGRIKVRRESAITLTLLVGMSLVGLSMMLARPPVSKAETPRSKAETTLTVTSTADAGGSCPGASCTLRQAIATAAAGDTINFSLPANSTTAATSSMPRWSKPSSPPPSTGSGSDSRK